MSNKYDNIASDFNNTLKKASIALERTNKSKPLSVLRLSERALNALSSRGIETIENLLDLSLTELKKIPNLGKGSVVEIFEVIEGVENDYFNLIEASGISNKALKLLKDHGVKKIEEIFELDLSSLGRRGQAYKEIEALVKKDSHLYEPKLDPKTEQFLALPINKIGLDQKYLNILRPLNVKTIGEFLSEVSLDKERIDSISEKDQAYFFHILKGLKQKISLNLTFEEIIDLILSKEEKGRQAPLKQRLANKITLEEAGAKIDVTRERVRQLEVKAIKKLQHYLPLIHVEFLTIRFSIKEPMKLWMFAIQNPFFENLDFYIGSKGNFHDEIFNHEFSCVQTEIIEDEMILCRGKKPFFYDLLPKIKSLNLKKTEVEDLLSACNRTDISDLILKQLEKNKPTSTRARSIEAVKEIFIQEEGLLSRKEIHSIFEDKYDMKIQDNQLSEALKENEGIYQFDKRSWGHEDNNRKLSDEELEVVAPVLIEKLILSTDKQRGRVGLLKELKKTSKNKNIHSKLVNLNPYDVDWILDKVNQTYPKLHHLKRGKWIWSKTPPKRIQISHVVLEILEKEGRPMKFSELEKRISEKSGRSNTLTQLRTNRNRPELIQLHPEIHGEGNFTMWGLRERDLPITKQQEKFLFELIKEKFNDGQKMIELDELKLLITLSGIEKYISPLQVVRMLAAYTSNRDRDNKYFSINFGNKNTLEKGYFRLENRIKYSYKEF